MNKPEKNTGPLHLEEFEDTHREEMNQCERILQQSTMSQEEAQDLVWQIREMIRFNTVEDSLAEALVAARKLAEIKKIVASIYPHIPMPWVIMDIVGTAEPERYHMLNIESQGDEITLALYMQNVRDFCEFDGAIDEWQEALHTARMIQASPMLTNFFEQVIIEKQSRQLKAEQRLQREIYNIAKEVLEMLPSPLLSEEVNYGEA